MSETLTVDGMSCGHCEQTVENAVAELDGVTGVTADESTDTLEIEGTPDIGAVRAAVEAAGYDPR